MDFGERVCDIIRVRETKGGVRLVIGSILKRTQNTRTILQGSFRKNIRKEDVSEKFSKTDGLYSK